MSKRIKILVVDDHFLLRSGLKLMLENIYQNEVLISESSNGEEAINQVKHFDYDIMLLDINLPDMSGIDVLSKIRALKNNIPTLILSMHNDKYIINKSIEAGANGYLLKNCEIEELKKAIDTVLERKKYYCNEVSQILLNNQKIKTNKLFNNDIKNKITEREYTVLKLIIKELTNNEIAEELCISKRTVEGHRANIINKLEVKNTAGLIRLAVENGVT